MVGTVFRHQILTSTNLDFFMFAGIDIVLIPTLTL